MAYQFVGKSEPKIYGAEKARGEAKFAGDFRLPGLLTAKVLRSPYPHAQVLKIDTVKAAKLPGIKAVVTSKDTLYLKMGRWIRDRQVLAQGKVRHIGDAVAAVAAVDEETALEALELIKVEYQKLPAVFNPLDAMREGSPLVHENPEDYQVSMPPPARSQGNICHSVKIKLGGIERAWDKADLVLEDSYSTQTVHQGFIQSHECVSAMDGSGKITLWTSTKGPFVIRSMVAKALGLPMSRLRVIAAKVGGDFGGKGSAVGEPICVLLTMKSGLPVKLVYTWEEEFTSTFIRMRSFSKLKTGTKNDGTLVAFQGEIVFDCGGYNDGFTGGAHGYNMLQGPYYFPNVDITSYIVYTNNTPTGPVRAPKAPQQNFAIESHMDHIAQRLGMDPLELRLKNAIKDGDSVASGGYYTNPGLRPTIEAAMDYIKKEKKEKEENVGWGIACAQWSMQVVGDKGPTSTVWVKLNEDGTVVIITGCTEQGGGQHDILVQLVAEVLKLPVNRISVIASDTDTTPYEQPTGGSNTTYRVGNSTIFAAEDAKQQIINLAAELLDANVDDLALDEGKVYHLRDPQRVKTLAEIGQASISSRQGAVMGIGSSLRMKRLGETRKFKDSMEAVQLGTHIVKLAVDRETGKVKILKYFSSHDVGKILNPDNVAAQINGGIVCGEGYALMEDVVTEEGRVMNPKLTDYKLPRSLDIPDSFKSSIVESPSMFGPFGAKGIGEPPCVNVAAAIANAVHDAVGVRIKNLPLTSEKIWKSLSSKGTKR
ncbi:xanthine dehydrogenase family protein molybdopterin-binding subunit [Chloroflexota bacterium]